MAEGSYNIGPVLGPGVESGAFMWSGSSPYIRWDHDGKTYQFIFQVTNRRIVLQTNESGSWENILTWSAD